MHINEIYQRLLRAYGPQGWWPVRGYEGRNPTKTGSLRGYHPGDYSFPRNNAERFEICIGAILTQNTVWPNVERAIDGLAKCRALSPEGILRIRPAKLAAAIRPSGYFNVKTKKLKIFAEFYTGLNGTTPARAQLLEVWGIGPETADSILLYAFDQLEFVVDAYTRRILLHLGLISANSGDDDIQQFCTDGLRQSVAVYQECHALFVEHAKWCYTRHPREDTLLTP